MALFMGENLEKSSGTECPVPGSKDFEVPEMWENFQESFALVRH